MARRFIISSKSPVNGLSRTCLIPSGRESYGDVFAGNGASSPAGDAGEPAGAEAVFCPEHAAVMATSNAATESLISLVMA